MIQPILQFTSLQELAGVINDFAQDRKDVGSEQ